jgi:alkylation response protein AidB-like acyl-CoA dehydrogenase
MNRTIAGRPVRSRPVHASTISEMALRIDCARALYQRIADMQRTGQFGRPGEPIMLSKSSVAHNYASDMAIWVVKQSNGINGLLRLLIRI